MSSAISFITKPMTHSRKAELNKRFYEDGTKNLRLLEYTRYLEVTRSELREWLHWEAIYLVPTLELVLWLKNVIGLSIESTIEIGAGNWNLSRFLGIKATDIKLQEDPEIIKFYERTGQPIIKYPKEVEKLSADDAVKKYQPSVVLACWVTQKDPTGEYGNAYGPGFNKLLDDNPCVDKFIFIGSRSVDSHSHLILGKNAKVDEYDLPFIVSRASKKDSFALVWRRTV